MKARNEWVDRDMATTNDESIERNKIVSCALRRSVRVVAWQLQISVVFHYARNKLETCICA
jgi:hypothetical protein